MKLIEFLKTLDPKTPLWNYSQALLVFCHQNKEYQLGQPEDIGNLGPSNVEKWIKVGSIQVVFNKTAKEALDVFYNKTI